VAYPRLRAAEGSIGRGGVEATDTGRQRLLRMTSAAPLALTTIDEVRVCCLHDGRVWWRKTDVWTLLEHVYRASDARTFL
jgi:enterochelin esterase-like enzyme